MGEFVRIADKEVILAHANQGIPELTVKGRLTTASISHVWMEEHAKILAHPSSVVVLTASREKDVTSSPNSAPVRMVPHVWKVKEHIRASVKPGLPDGTVNWITMTVTLTHVKIVSIQ